MFKKLPSWQDNNSQNDGFYNVFKQKLMSRNNNQPQEAKDLGAIENEYVRRYRESGANNAESYLSKQNLSSDQQINKMMAYWTPETKNTGVAEKRGGGRVNKDSISGYSLINDISSIASSIPEKTIKPLDEDRARVERTSPNFYAPEKSARSVNVSEQAPKQTKQSVPNKYKEQDSSGKKLVVPSTISNEDLDKILDEVGAKRMRRGGRSGLAANIQRQSAQHNGGLLHSEGAGRTDILNRSVTAGSYVIPADVVSALGDGNTMAGAKVLDQMMGPAQQKPSQFMNVPQPNYAMPEKKSVPVVMAGGEYVISKEAIIAKFGNLDAGHDALDEFVRAVRAKNVKKLKSLPGPRK